MAKHRASVFNVVREDASESGGGAGDDSQAFEFGAIVGTYETLQRAEEVAGSSAQMLRDLGYYDDMFRFTVQVSTYYAE